MKALEYRKGFSSDGIRDLLKSRVNSKGQVVLREKDLDELMEMVDYHVDRSFDLMRLPFEATKDLYKETV
jgi:hypothetical protein